MLAPERRHRWHSGRRLIRASITVAVLLTLWLGSAYYVAYKLTRRPHSLRPEPVPEIGFGTMQDFRLTTADGHDIGAWFIESRPGRPVVLYLHGQGGTRAWSLAPAERLVRAGYATMLITLRAHGDSTGDVNDFGYSARHDVLAAVDWLEAHHPGRPVVIFGQSLGAAAAMFAAKQLGPRVAGHIWECPYENLHTAVWNRVDGRRMPPGLSHIAYAGLRVVGPLVIPNADAIDPADAVADLSPTIPVLILAGRCDRHTRIADVESIHRRINSPSARLEIFDEAGHCDLRWVSTEQYWRSILTLIDQATSH